MPPSMQWSCSGKALTWGEPLPLLHSEAASNHRETLNGVTSCKQQIQLITHYWVQTLIISNPFHDDRKLSSIISSPVFRTWPHAVSERLNSTSVFAGYMAQGMAVSVCRWGWSPDFSISATMRLTFVKYLDNYEMDCHEICLRMFKFPGGYIWMTWVIPWHFI